MIDKAKPNELRIERIYDAPIQMVWDAWTDPEQTAKWWGPRGFTITTHSKDLRPGGYWSYTMHGPDGTDYENKTLYHEVESCAKLVYDHGGSDDRPPLFRVTALFSKAGDKTKLEMTMALATPEAAKETAAFIKKAGGNATWDRLSEYLEKNSSGKETFVIHRSFEAPIERVFHMWTDPEHFSKWLASKGFTMKFIRADIRTGGNTFYVMNGPNDLKMYGKAEYLKITPPHAMVYTQQFCDENEKVSRHPLAPTWPETMLTTVTFTQEGPDRTRVKVAWEPYGQTTREELDTFVMGRAGMTQGWTGSFDKLDDYL